MLRVPNEKALYVAIALMQEPFAHAGATARSSWSINGEVALK